MGSCWSDGSHGGGGMVGVGGTSSSAATANDAVDYYLKSRGFNGLFSQIEVSLSLSLIFLSLTQRFELFSLMRFFVLFCSQLSFSASNLRDGDVISKVGFFMIRLLKIVFL